MGGLSSDSHRFGSVADQCRGVKAVLADGSVVRLSETQEPELFAHALFGLGQIAVITQVAPLPPAPPCHADALGTAG